MDINQLGDFLNFEIPKVDEALMSRFSRVGDSVSWMCWSREREIRGHLRSPWVVSVGNMICDYLLVL